MRDKKKKLQRRNTMSPEKMKEIVKDGIQTKIGSGKGMKLKSKEENRQHLTTSEFIKKNMLDKRQLFDKVKKWEAKQLEKRKKMEIEMLQIAEKKNENPFVEIFRTIKIIITCKQKKLSQKEKAKI